MTQLDKIRLKPVKELAEDRIQLEVLQGNEEYEIEPSYWFHGDFKGCVRVHIGPYPEIEGLKDWELDELNEKCLDEAIRLAHDKAIELETEWLLSEVKE